MFFSSVLHRFSLSILALSALATGANAIAADAWPTKPVTLVVPSAAGGAADLTARTLAKYLSQAHGMNVVVENRAGAGGIIGTTTVQKAAPDGYTLLLSTNSTQSANQFLYKNLPYNAARDFVDVAMIGKFGTVAVVAPDSRFNTLAELVTAARETPEKVFFGYYSSSSQVPAELLKQYASLKVEGAAYKNVTQILTDLSGGLIQFAFVDYLTAMGQIAGGRLKPIAVTGQSPSPSWPKVPTTQSSYPGFVVEGWLGISAPVGTPDAVVTTMNGFVREAVNDADTQQRFTQLGLQPQAMDAAAFKAFVVQDVQRWKGWVETAKIEPQ
ncbi:Bug family tripartite tricarboxylate transporter substrate binding protein [Schauerella aestuarii]|uniref:Bug family tripartite tricarboxylate transporter substrate binding protein n=1 Tax=Schauerella aestuarii TaxID=2511204 RepID=UPI001369C599|nr:tripartite tricarboxylate transporter substrate binding protein [Achromobacter aestuarii]MYZ43559.1 tripartite tricarboxylate transporter substrate binding protein [Achromobacter aestuarii]